MINPHCITHSEIIEKLSRDGRFKSICKKIAKKPDMADELYQEFFLAICETADSRLVEADTGGFLEVLCVGIINNIWGKRHRVKTYEKGSTHPLHEICNYTACIVREDNLDERDGRKHYRVFEQHLPGGEEFDLDKAMKHERARDFVRELIEVNKESDDQSQRFRARVCEYSNLVYKNPRQFSRISGIPYRVCREANNQFKQYIIKQINDIHPDSGI